MCFHDRDFRANPTSYVQPVPWLCRFAVVESVGRVGHCLEEYMK